MQTLNKTHPKALSETELQSYCDWISQRIQGSQLQDVRTDGRVLVLELYGKGPSLLILDPKISEPALYLISGNELPQFKKVQKPVQLFLKSHAKNLALAEIRRVVELGRVLEFTFVNRFKEVRMQFILVPHFSNILIFADGKSISWSKPKEIPPRPAGEIQGASREFSWAQYGDSFLDSLSENKEQGPKPLKDNRARQILKKQGALEKLQASLSSEEETRWRQFGESLKGSEQAAPEYLDLWNSQMSLSENRERAFHKAKELRRKKSGTLARIEILKKEIENLEKAPASVEAPMVRKGTQAMLKSGSKGQTLNLNSGAQAIVGKSAKDNLAILRQSRAWDLWLHLKDEPSAHGVIFREKNQVIAESEINQVAQWILAKSRLAKNASQNFRFEVLVVECRFVKPIKGDKLGRVTYTSPRVYSFASKLNP